MYNSLLILGVSTDGISVQSLPSDESQSHDPKSKQTLSSDQQASLHQVIGN